MAEVVGEAGAGVDANGGPAVEDRGRGGAPPPAVVEVVFAIGRKRRVPRPKMRRAVVRPPAAPGSGHGARRTKEFLQWREWYLRKQRREKEMARSCDLGIPPPAGSWI